jgi:hypothetical protein
VKRTRARFDVSIADAIDLHGTSLRGDDAKVIDVAFSDY